MKKSFAIIALAALVMLAGCKKNDPKPNGTRLFAGIEKHKSDSKTSLDGLQIKWSEGDQLYVNNGSTSACFTLVSDAGTTTGEFATTGEYSFADANNLAVYPYNNDITVSGTTVTMTLPAVQEASGAGSFGNGANPMLGTFSDMDNLTLTSLCGVLCLQLKGDNVGITAIEIVGGPDDKLNGTFTVNDYTNPEPTYPTEGTNTVRLNFTETVTLTSTAQKFYVVVPADTLHGFMMKVYNGDNEIFSKSTANNVPVFVNTLSTMEPAVEVVPAPAGPLATPLTLEALTDGNIDVYIMDIGGKGGGVYPGFSKGGPGGGGSGNANRKYSVNNGEKTLIDMGITTIPVNAGDKVQFYGNGVYGGDIMVAIVGCPAQTKAYGNIMSLIDETGYATRTTLQDLPGAFAGIFYMNANLTDASGLLLPATTLSEHCYDNMFAGCTSLTTAPTLPATTLASDCYSYMFYGCTNLVTAPTLPATTLASDCYYSMFSGCTSLTTAPALPVETLASNCYSYMFSDCTSLTTAPTLPATTLDSECYYGMFNGCTSLTTAPALPAATLANWCYANMFNGCTSLTTAPELPATTLANSCYRNMFQGCTNLNSITCLATEGINENYSTYYWVDGVASTGTFNRASGATWPTGNNGIPEGWTLVPPVGPPALTMEALTAGNIVVNNPKSGMQYSINGGAKTPVTADAINVTTGDKVAFYGNGTSITNYNGTTINGSGDGFKCKVYGNIMSLLDEDNYAMLTTLPDQYYVFKELFSGNTKLTDASGLLLPATTLAGGCYFNMFAGCTSLTTAPELPATTLAEDCYYRMFSGCTSLTTAPVLPATTLADYCYQNMFSGCTSLTTAPALLVTTLAEECYSGMFSGCTKLTTAPALPATTLAVLCYYGMFSGCTSLVTAPTTLPATTLANSCYENMFSGCTSLTTAPALPATTLAWGCYSYMFQNCTSLSSITCLATAGINENYSTSNWLQGVASTGTFTKASGSTWPTGNNGIPSGWTVNEQ